MSNEPQQKSYRSANDTAEQMEATGKPAPKAFTWDDAREIAILVRDGLLMILKGIERKFDLTKK